MHGLQNGGPVYVEYLKQSKAALAEGIEVTAFNVPEVTGMKAEDVAAILEMRVHDIGYGDVHDWNDEDFQAIICTDGTFGSQIQETITAVCVTHGSVPMPTLSPFFMAELMASYDVVALSSRSLQALTAQGMSDYRAGRRQGARPAHATAVRTDMRRTLCMPSLPMKNDKVHSASQSAIPSKGFTVGILPTYIEAIPANISLYNSIIPILKMILERFPQCSILFKPYPGDLFRPQIAQLCETLKTVPRVRVAAPDLNSAAFYDMSDVIITDGSTAGVSHMLRKTVPPIYFVPQDALSGAVTRSFVTSIEKHVLMCHSLAAIEAKIRYLTRAGREELFRFYQTYCDEELFRQQTQQGYFRDILDLRFTAPDAIVVDADGQIWREAAEAAE